MTSEISMTPDTFLTVSDHNRDVNGMKYVYPVVSRRANGVSLGINLNVNNACNWRCVYCQVPNLTRGTPPPIELDLLEQELRASLNDILHGDFMLRYVAESDRHLQDIAFSGNGEPTSAKEFPQVLSIVDKVLHEFGLLSDELVLQNNQAIKVRLITNGSLMDKPQVLDSMRHLARCNGEVWFKVDAGTQAGIAKMNDVTLNPLSHIARLKRCAALCPTFVQTCMVGIDGQPPQVSEIDDYLALIAQVTSVIQGVHLYGLARPSYQPEASRLSRLSAEWLEAVAGRIRALGVCVFVSP